MMALANVVVEGQTMTVRDAQVDNMGVYNCTRDNVIVKSQRVTLVTAPRYELVYVLLYDAGETCELEDLRALHGELPAAVEAATCAHGRLCRVAVSEPVCLKPRGGKAGARRLRAEGASAAVEGGGGAVPCGARCRVTLQAGLAVLAATAVPAVLNTDVVLSTEAGNRTLRALIETDADEAGWHVSRALPKKERGSTEFHKLSSRMSSGELNLVLICGAGFYLIPHQKICVACPMGHYSRAGETSCRRCPAGRSTAAPGAAVCTRRGHRPHAANVQLHRYTRWLPELSPSSGALVAAGLLAGAAAAVTALSLLQCRGCRTGKSVEEGMGPAGMRTAAAAPPSRRASRTVTRARDRAVRVQRALSPSSVLLGFRARDAAPHHPRPRPVMLEEILEMPLPELPEDNRPPLPPIDFDL